MSLLFAPSHSPALDIKGRKERFAVRRAYAIGKNYEAHTRELGGDPASDPPLLFQKAPDCVGHWRDIPYPPATADLHYEGELVVALGPMARPPISRDDAIAAIFGYGVGIDFTRRDRQNAMRKRGGPWDAAKTFDKAGPVSALVPMPGRLLPPETRLSLHVNGQRRQNALISDMVWDVPALILELVAVFDLASGDLIFTGTPSGVGPVIPGDEVTVSVQDVASWSVRITG